MKKVKPVFTRTIMLIAIVVFALGISCDSIDISPVNCAECYPVKPKDGHIELKLTINDENPEVTIILYEDEFDEANLIYSKKVQNSTFLLKIMTNKEYVIEAKYMKDGRSYHVVNKAKLKTRRDTENCSEPCYYIAKRSVDLRIKD
jgi:hypothetical protein